jgi:hypothetical protein
MSGHDFVILGVALAVLYAALRSRSKQSADVAVVRAGAVSLLKGAGLVLAGALILYIVWK